MKKNNIFYFLIFISIIFATSCYKEPLDYSKEINDLKERVTDLQNRSDSLNNALKITNSNVASLTKTVDSIKNQLTSINAQLIQLNAQLSSVNVNITLITAQIGVLNQQYISLLAQLNAILAQLAGGLPGTPVLTTTKISDTTSIGAISGGTITSDGGAQILSRGVVWSTTTTPTVSVSTKTDNGTGVGTFVSNISGLSINTKYYVRAYATNSYGTSYGNEISFIPISGVTDIDGNKYKVVTIGNQVWMSENLKTTKYQNGDLIPEIQLPSQWVSKTTGAFSYYNNDANNNNLYGKLYNWYTVVDSRQLCPVGWHIPTDGEWTILSETLGGLAVAAEKMKSVGTTYWASPNVATNSSGFSALPNGCRCNPQGDFGGGPQPPNSGMGAVFWTGTELNTSFAYIRQMSNSLGSLDRSNNYKYYGKGVRCIKDK